jgi:hypothetical protein
MVNQSPPRRLVAAPEVVALLAKRNEQITILTTALHDILALRRGYSAPGSVAVEMADIAIDALALAGERVPT